MGGPASQAVVGRRSVFQSRSKGEEPMPHKFKVGDIVAGSSSVSRFVPGGVFTIIKLLPGNDEPEYRIKNSNEPHERVVRESELTKA
jgi:hypothetical protein